MMNRHDEPRTGGICHLDCLLGRTMGVNPRIVRADGHDRDVDWAVSPQRCEIFRHCCVTGENYPVTASFNQVPVVAAVRVALRACAPMLHRKCSNLDLARSSAKTFALAPIELCYVGKPGSFQ